MAIRSSKDLGATIRRARKEQKLKQTDLAMRASLRQPLISELENGTTNATMDTVLKVLAALKLDLTVVPRRKASFDPTEY
ncbi:MAG: helix-turn-helix domain-containing protein [Candidatus Thiodiazotropha endolucinida]|uniref:Helix-turn-helix domain-containing protein n=1 Tax=Candidatus Thiodiazotropha taylori TaxID=2792791 RepID=A0A9E4JS71_9GAMM|nr:helix-turn-helix domain-containing protein [Candidatus Thiodiazotropha sp. (ex Lucina pensylvanica)]MBT3016990.1 helix-turn-helix domain-containing protein [Candidatus Thiodiazotropha taylori]MBT3037352.1 helix-turn-helix domain-containing protein [Candidatus Thiodiazotropha sp. (ex Codakia orbicularis)]MBV2105201.1 helix-turn-helix domain-containing protein [Candidatus Thiodiazotropha sp. (ex Lucina aurantia)]MCG7862749.1 helix-turn-helix domain-containing protein [Candidatus Thiodiazotroph